ncbi:MAG: hypothetical protein A2283_05220 [Lentisphaerae bacterium RIFOXYA12_FULL_48_11]|nr:MAG: hypothetical protein A2283_05220 [Lentisphaerae bacterium RIFOXYA12_FULL_48_11]
MAGAVSGLAALFLGCEWESTDDGFNTSKGAGASVNFSGVYRAASGGVLAGSNITQIVVAQSGNAVEVWDNNNSYYTGSVGSPGIVGSADAVSGAYSAGAVMVQSQMNFEGRNNNSGRYVLFSGIVHAVAVNDVQGTTSSTTVTVGTNNTTTININAPPVTIDNENTDANTSTSGSSTTYSLTEANTQYVLDGNWIEEKGSSYSVSAIAPAVSGTFTTTSN